MEAVGTAGHAGAVSGGAGAVRFAAEDMGGWRAVFSAVSPPPLPGDALCHALTGLREDELVVKILAARGCGKMTERKGFYGAETA